MNLESNLSGTYNKTNIMDDSSILNESKRRKKNSFTKKAQNNSVNGGDVFQPLWLRCAVRGNNETDRVLLAYGRNFLFPFGIVLWIILLATQAI
jgi:hypothetical protein